MNDEYGLELAASRGIELRDVGDTLLQETDEVRVWSVDLDPGETLEFHFHHHPYVVVSLGGANNVVESIFGEKRDTFEPAGTVVYRNKRSPVHRLTNISTVPYRSRLIEFITRSYDDGEGLLALGGDGRVSEAEGAPPSTVTGQPVSGAGSAAATSSVGADADGSLSPTTLEAFKEVLIRTQDLEWVDKSLAGLSQKMLWRDEETGASIALVKFERGVGIPDSHAHASNQFMYCLSGKYRYIPTGTTLTPGSFYWNPTGSVHGPTIAEETTVLLEVYDGPHYPQRPSWYDNDEDAR